MDDLWVATDSYHEGRRLLDLIEDRLYREGLSLGSGKTSVRRAESASEKLRPTEELLDEMFVELLAAADPYLPSDDEAQEWRQDQVRELFDEAVNALDRDEYRRAHLTFALRQLGRIPDGYAIPSLPKVLLRMPGMTQVAANYMSDVAGPQHRAQAAEVLDELICQRDFHRPQEWLHLLRAAMTSGDQVVPSLVPKLAELARHHQHPLVRGRALLAWGRQSLRDDFSEADAYFDNERREMLSYALVAIQGKRTAERDARYSSWAGEGRSLARLAESLRGTPLRWSSV